MYEPPSEWPTLQPTLYPSTHVKRIQPLVNTIRSNTSSLRHIQWPSVHTDAQPHNDRMSRRTEAVQQYIRKRPGQSDMRAWPTLSPTSYAAPPTTRLEQAHQQWMSRKNKAESELDTLYASIHLRMYMLDLLQPEDYIVSGSLKDSLQQWLTVLGENTMHFNQ
jgi:hypothetical protein